MPYHGTVAAGLPWTGSGMHSSFLSSHRSETGIQTLAPIQTLVLKSASVSFHGGPVV